ncbi:MAG: amino acid ABC transporter permease [Oscillospiraceae bacterium]|jgi:polar amino acid transport system permease protein|nr:amino acid ABC transporter permease [Oscillospiraceae bacterium]MDY4191718.1 amino acid ABC transporter permease [Oscillospiraceae bacterium]
MDVSVIFERLTEAFWLNCKLFGLTLAFSLPLGLVVAFGSMSRFKPLAWLSKTFVWAIRGTPLMLQVIIIYFAPGLLFEMTPWGSGASGRLFACTIAFVINYACYFSEIYRGGIEAVPKGQYEAGKVLGLTRGQIFFKVILLQLVKRIIPPMGNEIITLIKDTALARIISNKEIIMMAQEYAAKGLIWPLFSTALYFLIFVGVLTLLFGWFEKKMDYFHV